MSGFRKLYAIKCPECNAELLIDPSAEYVELLERRRLEK